jgi:DNA-binding GntR family transcriptional regulator
VVHRLLPGDDPFAKIAAGHFKTGRDRPVYLFDRVRAMGPLAAPQDHRWDRAYVHPDVAMEFMEWDDLGARSAPPPSLIEAFRRVGITPLHREMTVWAAPATAEEAARLGVPAGDAVLHVEQISHARRGKDVLAYEYLVAVCGRNWKPTYSRL